LKGKSIILWKIRAFVTSAASIAKGIAVALLEKSAAKVASRANCPSLAACLFVPRWQACWDLESIMTCLKKLYASKPKTKGGSPKGLKSEKMNSNC